MDFLLDLGLAFLIGSAFGIISALIIAFKTRTKNKEKKKGSFFKNSFAKVSSLWKPSNKPVKNISVEKNKEEEEAKLKAAITVESPTKQKGLGGYVKRGVLELLEEKDNPKGNGFVSLSNSIKRSLKTKI